MFHESQIQGFDVDVLRFPCSVDLFDDFILFDYRGSLDIYALNSVERSIQQALKYAKILQTVFISDMSLMCLS